MKYLITGAVGFLGEALLERLVEQNEIVAVGRDEGKLIALREKHPNVRIVIGDIANKWVIKEAMKGVDGVFHLAAQKHVGLSEEFTHQTITSNVIGSMNILEESWITKPKFVLAVSTDKASNPKGVYGATKLLMEKLMKQAEGINPDTQYRVVRYGNVMGSTGSFITKWKPLMEAGKEVVLTDPKATRFYWTVDEAVSLIFECLEKSVDSTPYIPKMKAASMRTALEACQEVYGKCPVKIIGLQVGENMHETMDGITFSNEIEQFTKEEFIKTFLC